MREPIHRCVRPWMAMAMAALCFAASCSSAPRGARLPAALDAEFRARVEAARAALGNGDGDPRAAIKELEAAFGIKADDPEALRLRAAALAALGEPDAALEDLDKAVALRPGDSAALDKRAMLLAQRGDFRAAWRDIDAAIAGAGAAATARSMATLRDTKNMILVLADDLVAARKALDGFKRDFPKAGYSAIAEYRLVLAEKGPEAARAFAEDVLRSIATGATADDGFIKGAFDLLLGKADLRDFVTSKAWADYAFYLKDYSVPTARAGAPAAPGAAPYTVYLRPLDAVGVEEPEAAAIGGLLRNKAVSVKSIKVVDAGSRDAALGELEASLSGMGAAKVDAKLGEIVGCDRILSGMLSIVEGRRFCNLVLVDAGSGAIVGSAFVSWDGMRDAEAALSGALRSVGLGGS